MTMALETTVWDPIDDLASPDDELAYLIAAFEDGTPEVITAALADVVRVRGSSVVARDLGISRETLNRALAPSSNPTLGIVVDVFKALGFKLTLDATINFRTAQTEPGSLP